jgi:SAM-dependent methyltransferase
MTVAPELLDDWIQAWSAPPLGWDFSDVQGRMSESPTPWDFDSECVRAMGGASVLLDMGTGGGEQLLRLLDRAASSGAPARVLASEGWPPNVPVARAALAPRGVDVLEHDVGGGLPLPLPDASVDLVTNRHEAYGPGDVARVLRPGGVLLTQQVGSRNAEQARLWFGTPQPRPWSLDVAVAGLGQSGFVVEEADEAVGAYSFDSVAVLLRYFAHVPWDLPPGFHPEEHLAVLGDLHARTVAGEPLEMTQHRWWLRAVKP